MALAASVDPWSWVVLISARAPAICMEPSREAVSNVMYGLVIGYSTSRSDSSRGRGISSITEVREFDSEGIAMNTGRLEAFSDGVIAIIITIMVLELKVPHGRTFDVLLP